MCVYFIAFHFSKNTRDVGKTAKTISDAVGPALNTKEKYNKKAAGSVGTRSFNDVRKVEIQGTRLLENKKF